MQACRAAMQAPVGVGLGRHFGAGRAPARSAPTSMRPRLVVAPGSGLAQQHTTGQRQQRLSVVAAAKSSDITCYKCGQVGHIAKGCRQKVGHASSHGDIRCYKCGQVGHIAKECRQEQQCGRQAQPSTRGVHRTNPQEFGWVFLSRNAESRVDFYVHPETGTKMDYYFSTVKTMLDHPTQGKTQMFRRNLTEAEFRSVLAEPRSHTGKGYQTKRSKYYTGK